MQRNQPRRQNKIQLFFQAKRLIQIFWAVEFTLVLLLLQRLSMESYGLATVVVMTMLLILPVFTLAKKNKVNQASSVLLFTFSAIVITLMWFHGGLHDEVVLGFPCLLIMAAMFGNKKQFIVLLIIFSSSIALNSLANYRAWVVNPPPTNDPNSAILLLCILFLVSFAVWVAAKDFKMLIDKLYKENAEVLSSKKEIENLLLHDILTGLPNRAMAEIVFNKLTKHASRHQNKIYLMFIDLDNFKLINDALGHQAGDELLIEISSRLQKILRPSDTVCRFAGDEFIVIFDTVPSDDFMAEISEKIINTVNTPITYESNKFTSGCSIGISAFPDDGEDFNNVMRNADTAMYFSKENGGNTFHYFNDSMDSNGHVYLNIINDLRVAIKENQFFLVFQPKVDLKTQTIIGAEALIRWQHPKKGVIYPDAFIPEAEKSGLIVEIGQWVIQESCKACRKWIDLGFSELSIAVNVSSQQFSHNSITQVVKSSLKQANLDGTHLEIEMTESLLIDNSERLKSIFDQLRSLGVSFSVDDFGTGYSNLCYLKEFDVKTLKIDRTFVLDIENNEKNKILVKAIVQMAKGLGLQTVAEGIENIEAYQCINEFNCDLAQGYYWSKPIDDKSFVTYLKNSSK